MAFKRMPQTDPTMAGEICGDPIERFKEINGLLKWMVNCDPGKRPPAQVVAHHFRGYYLRSMLENDDVTPILRTD